MQALEETPGTNLSFTLYFGSIMRVAWSNLEEGG